MNAPSLLRSEMVFDNQRSAGGQLSQPSEVYSSTTTGTVAPLVALHGAAANAGAASCALSAASATIRRVDADFMAGFRRTWIVLGRVRRTKPYTSALQTQSAVPPFDSPPPKLA
jgi:hypothetical protein